ncbi:MAG: aminopeptidase P family protein [Bacteroidales bacterium]|nr:aminopeptidase P family protein [Bacteroidales bacterium]
METIDKLSLLRQQMKKKNLQAYIIPHSDPHISEYIPDFWKIREWISGFDGSAGTLAITADSAALWTDSRYFLQAERQLNGSGIELCKLGLPETPDISSWLSMTLKKGSTIGFDGLILSKNMALTFMDCFEKKGFCCNPSIDLVSRIWEDRPELPQGMAFVHPVEFAKISVAEKLGAIRKALLVRDATGYLMCSLDEICWTFNIRGADILYNPVVLSYAYIDDDSATLFIAKDKVDADTVEWLQNEGVAVKDYSKVFKFITKLGKRDVLIVDPAKTNYAIYSQIPEKVKVVESLGLAAELKARKFPAEIEGIKSAMVQDGIALVSFLHWLDQSVGTIEVTELSIAEKLLEFRSQRHHFVSESFGSIVGYKDHGAIVHYSASPETNYPIERNGFLLIDSGAQYLNGTTDITRTIHLGSPTRDEMVDYTLVLKGMICLASAKFPVGTRGSQLDTLARMALWNHNLNYGHGTGHGVGYFLNVHEGPQQIRPENHHPIEVGMVMSDEPGLYRPGLHGIRIENLIVCADDETNGYGRFLKFNTLTLCPIDTKPIARDMLCADEIEWLNGYHAMVYDLLSPHFSGEILQWLKTKTNPI